MYDKTDSLSIISTDGCINTYDTYCMNCDNESPYANSQKREADQCKHQDDSWRFLSFVKVASGN